jgi:hypothetical protein
MLLALRWYFLNDMDSQSEWMSVLLRIWMELSTFDDKRRGEAYEDLLTYHVATCVVLSIPRVRTASFTVHALTDLEGIGLLLSNAECTLGHALDALCPYVDRLDCKDWTVRARKVVVDTSGERTLKSDRITEEEPKPFLQAFVDPISGELDDTLILTCIDRDAGVDVAFLARTSSGEPRLVAIQAKNSDATFAEALLTLHPAMQYLNNVDRKALLTDASFSPKSKSVKRVAYEKFLEKHPVFKQAWVRMPAFGRALSPTLVSNLARASDDVSLQQSPILAVTTAAVKDQTLQGVYKFLTIRDDTRVSMPETDFLTVVRPRDM